MQVQILQYPAYSSDLALCDYHVCELLMDTLMWHLFGNEDKVNEATHLSKDITANILW